MTTASHDVHPSFEQVYPKAPFADLVRLVLWLSDGAVKLRAWLETARSGTAATTRSAAR
jgi:hypothetical protein